MGVVARVPWLGSVSECQCWVVVGEGLQHPALGNDFLTRKAVVSPVLFHLLPLFLFRPFSPLSDLITRTHNCSTAHLCSFLFLD